MTTKLRVRRRLMTNDCIFAVRSTEGGGPPALRTRGARGFRAEPPHICARLLLPGGLNRRPSFKRSDYLVVRAPRFSTDPV